MSSNPTIETATRIPDDTFFEYNYTYIGIALVIIIIIIIYFNYRKRRRNSSNNTQPIPSCIVTYQQQQDSVNLSEMQQKITEINILLNEFFNCLSNKLNELKHEYTFSELFGGDTAIFNDTLIECTNSNNKIKNFEPKILPNEFLYGFSNQEVQNLENYFGVGFMNVYDNYIIHKFKRLYGPILNYYIDDIIEDYDLRLEEAEEFISFNSLSSEEEEVEFTWDPNIKLEEHYYYYQPQQQQQQTLEQQIQQQVQQHIQQQVQQQTQQNLKQLIQQQLQQQQQYEPQTIQQQVQQLQQQLQQQQEYEPQTILQQIQQQQEYEPQTIQQQVQQLQQQQDSEPQTIQQQAHN